MKLSPKVIDGFKKKYGKDIFSQEQDINSDYDFDEELDKILNV